MGLGGIKYMKKDKKILLANAIIYGIELLYLIAGTSMRFSKSGTLTSTDFITIIIFAIILPYFLIKKFKWIYYFLALLSIWGIFSGIFSSTLFYLVTGNAFFQYAVIGCCAYVLNNLEEKKKSKFKPFL